MKEIVHGIEYQKPKVFLLNQSGIGTAELAGRTAYDSFENSENEAVKIVNNNIDREDLEHYHYDDMIDGLNNIPSSELLDSLAWVHHHHSVIEHVNLSYLIKGTSRGVLQELARHRIASYTVRSTRYTMSSVINAYLASNHDIHWFIEKVKEFDMFVITDPCYLYTEISTMFKKIDQQHSILGDDEFFNMCMSKDAIEKLELLEDDSNENMFETIQNAKKKRNVGDAFKHIVTDNWKVDLVMTINLRSLKNFFDLRDSGGAYFQIRWLAQEMKKATPEKYLRLVDKKVRDAK